MRVEEDDDTRMYTHDHGPACPPRKEMANAVTDLGIQQEEGVLNSAPPVR